MTINEMYPYWEDVHDELLDILEYVPIEYWDYEPAHGDARTIRQIGIHLIDIERFYIVHIANRGPWEHATNADFPDAARIIEGLRVTRNITRRYIESLDPVSLRAVRTISADPENNEPETNRPVSWVIWQVVRHDIYHLGQIQLRRQT